MGRKKIAITRIQDERNRQVCAFAYHMWIGVDGTCGASSSSLKRLPPPPSLFNFQTTLLNFLKPFDIS